MIDAEAPQAAAIAAVVRRFGAGAETLARNAGTRIVALRAAERFGDRSDALRRLGAGVDRWPIPPAGLFGARIHRRRKRPTPVPLSPVRRSHIGRRRSPAPRGLLSV